MKAKPLHFDCVVCQARVNEVDGEHATLVILSMLYTDSTPMGIHRDLCFAHRRRVESVAKEMASDA